MNRALVIKPKNDAEGKFLFRLFDKLGVHATTIDAELVEDIGMSLLLKDVNRNKKVSRESIMKKLQS